MSNKSVPASSMKPDCKWTCNVAHYSIQQYAEVSGQLHGSGRLTPWESLLVRLRA